MKIAIIGYSGAGKSTLAKKLAQHYHITPLHLDTIRHRENWQEVSQEKFLTELNKALNDENWIIDGNYLRYAKRRFEECDLLIFLNINRITCFFSSYYRFFKYRKKNRSCRPPLCRESYNWSFFKWVIRDGRTKERRAKISELLTIHKHKTIILSSRRKINRFVEKLTKEKELPL